MAQGTMPRCSVHGQVCPRSGETTVLFPQWVSRFQPEHMPLGGGFGLNLRRRGGKGWGRNKLRLRV